ncbi:MAG: muramoyltetrapeptide carboxypeptidase [Myxococcota bacterium]|jgi:muramoyltetrapeptide carboxypeptidase
MLSEGARVAVVAPSGIFKPQRLQAGIDLITSWGLEAVPGRNLNATHRITAGTVQQRVTDLTWALTADDIDAVWFARGGYGTAQLLPHIPWSDCDGRPVIGFSDATALLVAMERVGVTGGIHGPVLHSLVDHTGPDSIAALKKMLLEGGSYWLKGRHLCGPHRAVQGRLVGGNLCVLASLAGTPWSLRSHGAIVVLEDINEPAYKLDRLISQLRVSGAFDGAVGIALGEFTGCAIPSSADWTLEEFLIELLSPLGLPVISHLPVGHGSRNRPWQVGVEGVLSVEGLHVG